MKPRRVLTREERDVRQWAGLCAGAWVAVGGCVYALVWMANNEDQQHPAWWVVASMLAAGLIAFVGLFVGCGAIGEISKAVRKLKRARA